MGNFDRYSMLDGKPLCNVGGWHFDADIVHWIPCVLLFCSLEGATMVTGKSSSCQYLALLWKHDFWILLTWLSLSYFNIQIIVKITLFQPDVSQKTQQNEVFWWTTFDLTCHGSVWWHFLVVCCSLFLRSLQPIRQNCSCWCYLVPTSTQTSMNRIFFKEKMSCEIDWVKFVSPRLHSLMLTSLFIQGYFKPWKAPALNLIDSCSQFLFVSLLSIGLGGVERTNTAESESVLLLVGSVVCTLLTLIFLLAGSIFSVALLLDKVFHDPRLGSRCASLGILPEGRDLFHLLRNLGSSMKDLRMHKAFIIDAGWDQQTFVFKSKGIVSFCFRQFKHTPLRVMCEIVFVFFSGKRGCGPRMPWDLWELMMPTCCWCRC